MNEACKSIAARLSVLGHSEEGRPIPVLHLGRENAVRRVLVVAGQHGDEPGAREAAAQFGQLAARDESRSGRVALAVVSNLNPDGAARRTRVNAQGIDLNRDHIELRSAEIRALHEFVRSWNPHLIVDVHNYPARRKHLLARGLVYCHDVFVDVPTNSAIPPLSRALWEDRLLEPMIAELSVLDYRCGRYALVRRSGKVRHSTLDVVDARNGLALRYGVPCLLVEGRQAAADESRDARRRLHNALTAAVGLAVARVEPDPCQFIAPSPPPRPGEPIVMRSRLARGDAPFTMEFRNIQTSSIETIDLGATYSPRVEATVHAALPRAYAVPRGLRAVIDLLERQGFPRHAADPCLVARVERDRIDAVRPSQRPDSPPGFETTHTAIEQRTLGDSVLFPTNHAGGRVLAVLLEPSSRYGLGRYASLGLSPPPGSHWPILRVV